MFERLKQILSGKRQEAPEITKDEVEAYLNEMEQQCNDAKAAGCSPAAADLLMEAIRENRTNNKKHDNKMTALEEMILIDNLMYCNDLNEIHERFSVKEGPNEDPKIIPRKDIVYGAMYGDICGSAFEGHSIKLETIDGLDLIGDYYNITDDSILTAATMNVIAEGKEIASCYRSITLKDIVIDTAFPIEYNPYAIEYHEAGNAHPRPKGGYGTRFKWWLEASPYQPYGSLGNGAAMRVSPIGAYYDTQYEVIRNAAVSAMATHNHVEGVKGAVVTAMCIWMIRNGYSKQQVFEYMKKHYSYGDKIFEDFTYEEANKKCDNQETCQYSVPAAIISFVDSKDYKDAILKAVCVGRDSDTNACICGGIAAAYYGITEQEKNVVESKLEKENIHIEAPM